MNDGLTERDKVSIHDIFNKFPEVKKILLFGSRAKGNYKNGSDIDLAIKDSKLGSKTIGQIKSEFEESSIPYKVDLVDYNTITNLDFRDHIDRVGIVYFRSDLN